MLFHAATPHRVELLDGRKVVIDVRKRISARELRAIVQNQIDTGALVTAFTGRRPDWIDEVRRNSLSVLSNLCLSRAVKVMEKKADDPVFRAQLEKFAAVRRDQAALNASVVILDPADREHIAKCQTRLAAAVRALDEPPLALRAPQKTTAPVCPLRVRP